MSIPSWPHDLTLQENVPAVATTGSLETQVGRVRHPARVAAVYYVPSGAVTGGASNNRTLTLYNRGGSAGTGTVSLASVTLNTANNLSDNVAKALTLASGERQVSPGDTLEWVSTANSGGLADPGGYVVVQLSMRS